MTEAERLLIVDDDEVFCLVLSKALTKRGYQVAIAYDQQQALATAQEFKPHKAIVDLRIGPDSGLNVLKRLVEQSPDIQVVVLTGFASISTAVEAIKLGATQYLTKPAGVDDILASFDHSDADASIPVSDQPLSVKRLEWEHLQKVLSDHDGNISAAARAMGMHRRTLQRKLAKRPVRH